MSIATPELRRLLGVAERAARAGGTVIRTKLAAGPPVVTEKAAGDYVTEIDMASERTIAMRLRGETPDIPIQSEEGDEAQASVAVASERYWVVDPLDGTTNFLHGFPIVGVSVALVMDGRPVVGCVHAPFSDETYTAVVGGGAHLARGRERATKLSVSDRPADQAIIATGFPFRTKALIPRHLAALGACLERFEDLRRPGAASIDLALVAAGVFEGFFELGLSAWDVAAGALLIEEAGGVVSDWDGGENFLGGNILGGSPEVHEALLEIALDTPAQASPSPAPAATTPPAPAPLAPETAWAAPEPDPTSGQEVSVFSGLSDPAAETDPSSVDDTVSDDDEDGRDDDDWESLRDAEVLAELATASDDVITITDESEAPADEASEDEQEADEEEEPEPHNGMRPVARPAEPVTPPLGGSAFPTRPS